MRKLMWIGAGFTAACVLGAYCLSGGWLFALGLFLLAASVGLLIAFRNSTWRRTAAFACLGLAMGALWFCGYSAVRLAPAKKADGQVHSIRAEAADYSYDTGYGTAVDAKLRLDDM